MLFSTGSALENNVSRETLAKQRWNMFHVEHKKRP